MTLSTDKCLGLTHQLKCWHLGLSGVLPGHGSNNCLVSRFCRISPGCSDRLYIYVYSLFKKLLYLRMELSSATRQAQWLQVDQRSSILSPFLFCPKKTSMKGVFFPISAVMARCRVSPQSFILALHDHRKTTGQ